MIFMKDYTMFLVGASCVLQRALQAGMRQRTGNAVGSAIFVDARPATFDIFRRRTHLRCRLSICFVIDYTGFSVTQPGVQKAQ